MGRTAKYQTADDLLDNTTVRNDCLVWPSANVPIPCIAPASPMAQKFYTNSVARILFTITRYPPGGTRLVRVCSTHFCVNPFHHVEPKIFRLQRQKLLDPHGLLPSQESKRDLIAPPDDYIATLYPRKPQHVRFLSETAARAGYDGKGLRAADRKVPPPTTFPNVVYADPDKPLFKLKPKAPVPTSPEIPISSTHSEPINSPALDEEDRSPDSFASELDLPALTQELGPAEPVIDTSPHPHDFGRDEATRKRMTLHNLLAGLTK